MVAFGTGSSSEITEAGLGDLDKTTHERMAQSFAALSTARTAGVPIYGVTRGFGPLSEFDSEADSGRQGAALIAHLSAGQGEDLDLETTRLMLELRITGMSRGYSGIAPERWQELAHMLRAGFVPVVPALGSLSASGDLIPLAHAARAMAGDGMAWDLDTHPPARIPASHRLHALGLAPIAWTAREALAFVNGTSASLAATLLNQRRLRNQCWAAAMLTGIIVDLLHANTEPYDDVVATARGGSPGHRLAARWIGSQLTGRRDARTARQLQEPYSLRCAPQVLGTVLDFLDAAGALLDREAAGCSDNPVVSPDGIHHAGNFYAITAALTSDQHAILVHQLAFMAERQLAMLVNPARNGGLPPLLAWRPGATSGVAGAQIAATAFLAEIRQAAMPATITPVPTNLDNQDIVPMALMASLRVTRQLTLSSLILGSVGLAVAQVAHHLRHRPTAHQERLAAMMKETAPLHSDRPLADEVRAIAEHLRGEAERHRDAGGEGLGG